MEVELFQEHVSYFAIQLMIAQFKKKHQAFVFQHIFSSATSQSHPPKESWKNQFVLKPKTSNLKHKLFQTHLSSGTHPLTYGKSHPLKESWKNQLV